MRFSTNAGLFCLVFALVFSKHIDPLNNAREALNQFRALTQQNINVVLGLVSNAKIETKKAFARVRNVLVTDGSHQNVCFQSLQKLLNEYEAEILTKLEQCMLMEEFNGLRYESFQVQGHIRATRVDRLKCKTLTGVEREFCIMDANFAIRTDLEEVTSELVQSMKRLPQVCRICIRDVDRLTEERVDSVLLKYKQC